MGDQSQCIVCTSDKSAENKGYWILRRNVAFPYHVQ